MKRAPDTYNGLALTALAVGAFPLQLLSKYYL